MTGRAPRGARASAQGAAASRARAAMARPGAAQLQALDAMARSSPAATALAALQRAADARGGVVQGKNLKQTGWAGVSGLVEDSGGERSVIGDGRNGKVYHDPKSIPVADRTEGFAKAAEMNARVGKTVDEEGRPWANRGPGTDYDTNAKWTPKAWAHNDARTRKIDPFFYEAIVSWRPSAKAIPEYLGFMFQHAANFTGYVEAVLDTSNPGARGVPTMYDAETGKANDPDSPKYSNIHEDKDGGNLLDMTRGGGEESFDAYTKIAGEGARWQCVRRHGANLTNDTYFYTRQGDPGRDKVWAVSFKTLWLSWKADFDKAYDIPDAQVRAKILDPGTTLYQWSKNIAIDKLDGRDYDLG